MVRKACQISGWYTEPFREKIALGCLSTVTSLPTFKSLNGNVYGIGSPTTHLSYSPLPRSTTTPPTQYLEIRHQYVGSQRVWCSVVLVSLRSNGPLWELTITNYATIHSHGNTIAAADGYRQQFANWRTSSWHVFIGDTAAAERKRHCKHPPENALHDNLPTAENILHSTSSKDMYPGNFSLNGMPVRLQQTSGVLHSGWRCVHITQHVQVLQPQDYIYGSTSGMPHIAVFVRHLLTTSNSLEKEQCPQFPLQSDTNLHTTVDSHVQYLARYHRRSPDWTTAIDDGMTTAYYLNFLQNSLSLLPQHVPLQTRLKM
jgi:hypothetical protein